MRNELLFSLQETPFKIINGISMCLFIIRSWNSHLEHFSSDKIYSTYSSLFCFTKTNIDDSPVKPIDESWVIGNTSVRIYNMTWLYVTT